MTQSRNLSSRQAQDSEAQANIGSNPIRLPYQREIIRYTCEHCYGTGKVCNDGNLYGCPKCGGYGEIKEMFAR